MKQGLGTVTCGICRTRHAVFWPGHKYKMKCMNCGAVMNIHRQRLKNFETMQSERLKDSSGGIR